MVTVPLAYKTTFGSQKSQVFLNGKMYSADLAKTIIGMVGAEQEGWIWLKVLDYGHFLPIFPQESILSKTPLFVYCQMNLESLCQKIYDCLILNFLTCFQISGHANLVEELGFR